MRNFKSNARANCPSIGRGAEIDDAGRWLNWVSRGGIALYGPAVTAAGTPSTSVTGGGAAWKASAIRTIMLKNEPM